MPDRTPMSLDDFMRAPLDEVRAVAPRTVLYAVGGTRRQAVLAGLSPDGEEYPRFSAARMYECLERLFDYGVQHVIATVLQSPQLAEVGRYRERVMAWLEDGLAGDEALAVYRERGWRARLLGGDTAPELDGLRRTLRESTPAGRATLWYYVSLTPDEHWHTILQAAASGARTQAEVVAAVAGEAVPPAELLIAFGKPLFGGDIFPSVFAAGTMQCYWTQRPGYDLPDADLRRILYDYAFTRRTWVPDKRPRYESLVQQRDLWAQGALVGVGRRAGGFWYPVESLTGAPE
jgi:hypothetical protein